MENGRLTDKQLAAIFHPSLSVSLAAAEAAASWNTMRLFLLQKYGQAGQIYPEGPLGAYRNLAGQVQCKKQFGKNAATPGKSNHGWGKAVDVATNAMANLIDRHGPVFGWHHWDAKWEWWHREYDGGFDRPDPGTDEKNPVLRQGSGGPGQHGAVLRLQRRLNALKGFGLSEDGDFGDKTVEAVIAFQQAQGLGDDGVVGINTWQALQGATPDPGPKPKPPKPKPAPSDGAQLLRGFDVSDVRGDVDFAAAKAGGISFAVVRVADGDVHDTRYGPGRVKALRASGLAWFPYYYGRVASAKNGQRDGAAEAAMAIGFARAAGWGKKGDLPLAYDFETPNGQPPKKCARHLVQFVQAYRDNRGHFPIIYTMPGFWVPIVGQLSGTDRALVSRCPLWIAHWHVPSPQTLDPWGEAWALWQDSDGAAMPGVPSKCDTDYFRTTDGDFSRLIVS